MIKIRTLYIVLPLTILMAVGCYLKGLDGGHRPCGRSLALVWRGAHSARAEERKARRTRRKRNNAPCAKKKGSFRRKLSFRCRSAVSAPRFVRSAACILRRSPL